MNQIPDFLPQVPAAWRRIALRTHRRLYALSPAYRIRGVSVYSHSMTLLRADSDRWPATFGTVPEWSNAMAYETSVMIALCSRTCRLCGIDAAAALWDIGWGERGLCAAHRDAGPAPW